MGKIVAIGGGEVGLGETKLIDKYIVKLSEKREPKLLFIPTASCDAEGYIKLITKYFGELGCQVSTLRLVTDRPTDEVIHSEILEADIIYVGGGDTIRMMEKWRERKVDVYLREAYDKGTVLSGISAGSICWFEFGHSDGDSFVSDGTWEYVKVQGLGLIPMGHCPHYDEEGREGFDEMMLGENLIGIALENQTAFVALNGVYHVIKAHEDKHTYRLENKEGQLLKQLIV